MQEQTAFSVVNILFYKLNKKNIASGKGEVGREMIQHGAVNIKSFTSTIFLRA